VASPVTLRLDPEIRRRVAQIARRKRTTTSEVLREAITAWVEREETTGSVYESIKDLIGSVHGGDPRRSENAGRKVTEMLKARRNRS
jgi:Arc/MetJ-type ribon-helix-helix transcriptional regulator